jgi:DNA-binding transcriptional regulator/RsmH inhibitor MraZ
MVEAPKVGRRLHATQDTDFDVLVGNHDRLVDDKGRVTLPAGRWREAFASTAYLGPWRDGSLAMWPPAQFQAFLDQVAAQEREGIVNPGAIETVRRHIHAVPVDSQGRFTIPPQLREARNIAAGAQLSIEGQGDRLEARLTEREDRSLAAYDDVIDIIDHR